jgi:predicted transglutaminase-like cysteine proteinase
MTIPPLGKYVAPGLWADGKNGTLSFAQLQESKRKENELTPEQMEGLERVRQGVY